MDKLIKCGKFFSAVDYTVKSNIGIIIRRNVIIDILSLDEIKSESDYEVIDLQNQFVMPGLIDTHIHCNLNGTFEPYGQAYSFSAAYYALKSLPHVQADLLAGFTTVRDMGCAGFSDIALRDVINQGIHWGPRIFTSGLPVNVLGGAGDTNFQPPYQGGKQNYIRAIVCGADEARQAARFNFKYGADQVKMLATAAVLGSSDEAGIQELTYEEMRAMVKVAEFRGKISAAHAIGNKGIKAAIKAGVVSIEHGSYMDEEAAEMMIEKGTYHVPTLIALERILEHIDDESIPPYAIKKAKDCEQARIKAFQISLDKGVKIAFGSDAATPYNKHGEQAYEFELMVKFGMNPADAIISATRTAAELLRWNDRLGTLEVGKLADIISTRENPIEDISALKYVAFVMKDGKVYKSEQVKG